MGFSKLRVLIWVWINTYRYIFSGMNIHLPAILGFTRYQGFDQSPYSDAWLVYKPHKYFGWFDNYGLWYTLQ